MKRLFLIILGTLAFFSTKAQTSLTEAVDFSVKDINGELHELFDILDNQEKYVFIDFFGVY